jgi:hypothetical protein
MRQIVIDNRMLGVGGKGTGIRLKFELRTKHPDANNYAKSFCSLFLMKNWNLEL